MIDSHDGQPAEHDSRPTVTVAEAARILGVTVDSVRSRLHRGTLEGWKEENTWRVRLPEGVEISTPVADATPELRQPPTGNVTVTDSARQSVENAVDNALVEQLRSENDYLRGRLEEADRQRDTMLQQMADERERFDVIHRAALGRIEALTATVADGQERQPSTEHAPEPVETPESDESPLQRVRALLHRLLGG